MEDQDVPERAPMALVARKVNEGSYKVNQQA